jgi:HD superfamily phosphodiesterase
MAGQEPTTTLSIAGTAGHGFSKENTMALALEGVAIPDSKLARDITEVVRDTASPLLFHHSSRVYYFGALAGKHHGLKFDPELLYAGAMFHDMGLTPRHSSPAERFEVDSANAARDFLRGHGISEAEVGAVWTAIALHTTPGIPQHMHPVIALVTAGVEMDVLGLAYPEYSDVERDAIVTAHPRTPHFKEDIIQAFYDGNRHKPDTTFGNVNADVIADKEPDFHRGNFCSVIRQSAWPG